VCFRVLTVKAGGLFDAAEVRTEVCKKVVVKGTAEMTQKKQEAAKMQIENKANVYRHAYVPTRFVL